jgi:hypothetical protein
MADGDFETGKNHRMASEHTLNPDDGVHTPRIISQDVALMAAKLELTGHEPYHAFGHNPLVTTMSDPEDVWEGGGLYTGFPAEDEIITLSSSDPGDDQDWEIQGLDTDWNRQTVTITADGTNLVDSLVTFRRVYRVINRGSTNNAGIITVAHKTTTANIFAAIPIGVNQAQAAIFTVPAGMSVYVQHLSATLLKEGGATFDRDADIYFMVREPGQVFRPQLSFGISNAAPFEHPVYGGFKCPEKTDIVMRVIQVSNDTGVFASFDLLCVLD